MGEPSQSGGRPSPAPPPPPPPPPMAPAPLPPLSSVHGYGGAYGGMGYPAHLGMGMGYPAYSSLAYPGAYGAYAQGGVVGAQGDPLSLARLAEDRTRGAFQSLDSLVQAVSSVSMLLESSSTAIQSSFRAVIGVAEQFGRLRSLFSSLVLSAGLCRFLRWLWRRLLVFLRLRPANWASDCELAWTAELGARRSRDWTSLIFLAISIGAPWLLYKATATLLHSARESQRWIRGEGPHYTAKALYEFNGTDPNTLSLSANQLIRVAPKDVQPQVRGWLLAADLEGTNVGLVPINYVTITARHPAASAKVQPHPPPNLDALW